MADSKQTIPNSRTVAIIGFVAVVLAAPFGRWLGLSSVILALLMTTVAVMTVWVVVRTVQAEHRSNAEE